MPSSSPGNPRAKRRCLLKFQNFIRHNQASSRYEQPLFFFLIVYVHSIFTPLPVTVVCAFIWSVCSAWGYISVRHPSEDLQPCVWWEGCDWPSPNWYRKDLFFRHPTGGETAVRAWWQKERETPEGKVLLSWWYHLRVKKIHPVEVILCKTKNNNKVIYLIF